MMEKNSVFCGLQREFIIVAGGGIYFSFYFVQGCNLEQNK